MQQLHKLKAKDEWFRSRRWRILLNLKIQPQTENDAKLWMQKMKKHPGIIFKPKLMDQELHKKMENICRKISCGYCARVEEELLIIIPLPIKKMIGKIYLYVEPSIFRAPPDYKYKQQLQWNRYNDEGDFDTNQCPATNSISMESIPGVSDCES